ncbi:MAG: AP2 domain-containing protein [Candidatus Hadarchaeum sp.]
MVKGRAVLLDDDDYPVVKKRSLKLLVTRNRVYPAVSVYDPENGSRTVTLARFIMGMPPGREVTYKNGDTFDNRRINLLVSPRGGLRAPCSDSEIVPEGVERTPTGWLVRAGSRVIGEFALLEDARQAVSALRKKTKGPYIGVSRRGSRYAATYFLNGRRLVLGVYDTPEEAARAYDRLAKFLDPKAPLNFPGEDSEVPVKFLDQMVEIPDVLESLAFP